MKYQVSEDYPAVNLRQTKEGNWVRAEEEPYYSTFVERLMCKIGWHSKVAVHDSPDRPTLDVRCYKCDKKI